MSDDPKTQGLGEPVAAPEAPTSQSEPKGKSVVDPSEFETKAKAIARQEALEAEERAFRRAQSKFDSDLDKVRKENREREASLIDQFATFGIDPSQIDHVKNERTRVDELETLKQKAALADAYQQQAAAKEYREKFVKELCAEAGVSPDDKRLDLTNPDAFQKSVIKILKEERAKPSEPAGETKEEREARLRTARADLDVISGGTGGLGEEKPKPTLDDASDIGSAIKAKYGGEWKKNSKR